MTEKLMKKRKELESKLMNPEKGSQKGFTLMEMLIVVLIIVIIIGIMVISFTFFGRVDGTELTAKSKNVESAVLQVALGDNNRDIPALGITGDGVGVNKKVTRVDDSGKVVAKDATVKFDGDAFFESEDDAKLVIDKVAKQAGLDYDKLLGLLRPVDTKVQKAVAGDVKASDYVVVVRKSQLYTSKNADYKEYNDELSGLVFSKKTIVDSENKYYNGTSKYDGGTK